MSIQTLSQIHRLYQDYAQNHVFNFSPIALYHPINYILQLKGKKLRPILLLLSYYLFDEKLKTALAAAYGIEIFHNFTLLHDDIMDNAPLRRGQPTVHEIYNVNTAILSGDVMMIYAYQYLLQAGLPNKVAAVIEIFNQAAIKVCEGQQYDMEFEQRLDVSIAEYLLMIEYKTAALLEAAIEIGATLANTHKKNIHHIKKFAHNIGIAFQLQDDILDTFGDPLKFGKKVGGDIIQNKKTFLILKALEVANETQKQQLQALYFGNTTDEKSKITAVVDIFNQLSIKKRAEILKDSYQKRAFEHLSEVETSIEKRNMLQNLAESLLVREK